MKRFLLAAVAVSALASPAFASEVLVNGNFETGGLAGWAVIDQAGGSGSWFANGNGASTPLTGNTVPTLATGGTTIAITDQTGPGSHQLTQTFAAFAGQSYILSFDAYANDLSGAAPVGTGLDYTNGVNQHLEINLSGAGAGQIFYGTFTTDWTAYSYDISSLITADGLYTLSFGEVDNQLFYNFGLDNVSLVTGAVPEPGSWAMMIMGFGLAGAAMRRRKTPVVFA